MHLQVIGYFSRCLPIQAHQNPLDAQDHSGLLILLCLPEFQVKNIHYISFVPSEALG